MNNTEYTISIFSSTGTELLEATECTNLKKISEHTYEFTNRYGKTVKISSPTGTILIEEI